MTQRRVHLLVTLDLAFDGPAKDKDFEEAAEDRLRSVLEEAESNAGLDIRKFSVGFASVSVHATEPLDREDLETGGDQEDDEPWEEVDD